jgi:hypothetical protein
MGQAHVRHARYLAILLTAVFASLAVLPIAAAHAEWYFTKTGAQRVAKDFVSKHYANTAAENLTAACRPQGRPFDPRYKFHRWVCGWYDSSDNTAGTVLIVGSDNIGAYYGRVLAGARYTN